MNGTGGQGESNGCWLPKLLIVPLKEDFETFDLFDDYRLSRSRRIPVNLEGCSRYSNSF
jgi:hypothetical protein